jgi:hypothetical protein
MPVRRVASDLPALLESTINVMELQARAIDVALTLDVGSDVPRLLLRIRQRWRGRSPR